MVVGTAGLGEQFIPVYFSALILSFIVSAFIARIPPFNKKRNIYLDGREQTKEDIERAKAKGNAVKIDWKELQRNL